MGMDLVELTMNIEDEFQLRIPDDEASRLETVGQTYDYLRAKLHSTRSDRCSSMVVFNRLRRSLMHSLGVPRDHIRPATPIAELFTGPTAAEQRIQLAMSAGLFLPPIGRAWVRNAIATALFLGMVAMIVLPVVTMSGSMAALGSFLALCVFIAGLRIVHVREGAWVRPVSPSETFGSMVRKTVVLNRLPAITSWWTDERIWLTLTQLISEQLGVRVEDLKRESHYIKDLHAF